MRLYGLGYSSLAKQFPYLLCLVGTLFSIHHPTLLRWLLVSTGRPLGRWDCIPCGLRGLDIFRNVPIIWEVS